MSDSRYNLIPKTSTLPEYNSHGSIFFFFYLRLLFCGFTFQNKWTVSFFKIAYDCKIFWKKFHLCPVYRELGIRLCIAIEIWTSVCLFPQDDEEDTTTSLLGQKKPGYHAPVAMLNAIPQSTEEVSI